VIALLRLAAQLAPAVLDALVGLARLAAAGASATDIRRQAEKLAHVVAFEAALRAARRG
jgi:hypothetical protein